MSESNGIGFKEKNRFDIYCQFIRSRSGSHFLYIKNGHKKIRGVLCLDQKQLLKNKNPHFFNVPGSFQLFQQAFTGNSYKLLKIPHFFQFLSPGDPRAINPSKIIPDEPSYCPSSVLHNKTFILTKEAKIGKSIGFRQGNLVIINCIKQFLYVNIVFSDR